MTTLNDLREYIDLADKALDGPWRVHEEGDVVYDHPDIPGDPVIVADMTQPFHHAPDTAEFIAVSRTLGPEAAKLVVEMLKTLEKIEWASVRKIDGVGYAACPFCGGICTQGHSITCDIGNRIKQLTGEAPTDDPA